MATEDTSAALVHADNWCGTSLQLTRVCKRRSVWAVLGAEAATVSIAAEKHTSLDTWQEEYEYGGYRGK